MSQIPEFTELKNDETLVVEFDEVGCLEGFSRWVLVFKGDDSSSVLIKAVGRMVIPRQKTIQLDDEQKTQINLLLRSLPTYVPAGTSHCNFRVFLQHEDECVSTWEFNGVHATRESVIPHHILLALCQTVPHDYRKGNLWEYTGSGVIFAGFGVVAILGLLIRALWFPIGYLRRVLTR